MTKRWKDHIQVLVQTSGTYDAWGHLDAESWEVADEVWAEVRPQQGSKSTATVTVRAPFDFPDSLRICWNDRLWTLIHPPIRCPESQFIQFKIELK